jgi:hypothetical protein
MYMVYCKGDVSSEIMQLAYFLSNEISVVKLCVNICYQVRSN